MGRRTDEMIAQQKYGRWNRARRKNKRWSKLLVNSCPVKSKRNMNRSDKSREDEREKFAGKTVTVVMKRVGKGL